MDEPRSNQPSGTFVEALRSAPFPYRGKVGDTKIDFFDFKDPATGERFHTNRYGERLSEKEHYSDSSVLFYIPTHFNPNKPFTYVVFFHGNWSEVRKALSDYRLDEQIEASGRNVILIAPQFARNAADSSPGKFSKKFVFRDFMHEAANVLHRKIGLHPLKNLQNAPMILTAFSGGYKPVASVLDHGGVASRVRGVLLLDALYDDVDTFRKWVMRNAHSCFFIDIYSESSSCEQNSELLASSLLEHRLTFSRTWPEKRTRRGVVFMRTANEHMRIPLLGPPENPLLETLRWFGS